MDRPGRVVAPAKLGPHSSAAIPQAEDDSDRWHEARRSLAVLDKSAASSQPIWLTGTTALYLAVVLLIGATFLVNLTIERLRDGFRWVQHANEVLLAVDGVQETLLEAISAARGYALAGDQGEREQYEAARKAVGARLSDLRSLVADNPDQLRRLDALRPLIDAHLERQTMIVALGAGRIGETARLIGSGALVHERPSVDALLRSQMAAFRATEVELLAKRERDATDSAAYAVALSVATALIAVGCGTFGIWLIRHQRTERDARELQLELMHTQRLGMMGQMSSMLAHEINQPLAAASNYLATLNRLVENSSPEPHDKMVEIIRLTGQQIKRASQIVQRLRGFIDKRPAERTLESPSSLIQDAVALLGTLDARVKLSTRIDPDLPWVTVDRIQLQQVLVNLMRNALEAMQNSEKQELALTVSAPERDTVEFRLRDSGSGLPKEVADRLFQPFVTSKKSGLGVGLSICHTIITQHGGHIWAQSSRELGTVFSFTLPAALLSESL